MTSDIRIKMKDGRLAKVKPISVKWKCDAGSYCDTCTIQLPLHPYMVSKNTGTDVLSGERVCLFAVGGSVSVSLGYDGNNAQRFAGFLSAVNYDENIELKAEGYYYQLKGKRIDKSWKKVTLKQLLQYVTTGTDIKLSSDIPNIDLGPVSIKNAGVDKIFDWLKSEFKCEINFCLNTLYAGALTYGQTGETKKLRMGWNVREGKLTVQPAKEQVQINLVMKDSKGKTERVKSTQKKYKSVKDEHIHSGLPAAYLKSVCQRMQDEVNNEGRLGGDITAFLIPSFRPGMVAQVDDTRYPDRGGHFFIKTVEGSFDKTGGKQKLNLRYYGE